MKDLTKEQIRARVAKREYTDMEWNRYALWQYVDYKTNIYLVKGKLING